MLSVSECFFLNILLLFSGVPYSSPMPTLPGGSHFTGLGLWLSQPALPLRRRSLGAPLGGRHVPLCSRWGGWLQSSWMVEGLSPSLTPQRLLLGGLGLETTDQKLPKNQEEVLHSRGTHLLVSSWLQVSAPRC